MSEKRKAVLHVRLDDRLHRAVSVVAERVGSSLTAAATEALTDWLEKKAREEREASSTPDESSPATP